jgi:hypothetical protein
MGMRSRPAFMAMKVARSRMVHSHSRFWSIDMGPDEPKVSLLSVVSIWKIFTPASRITLPMRQLALCSSEWWRSMKLRDSSMVRTLWWWRRLR